MRWILVPKINQPRVLTIRHPRSQFWILMLNCVVSRGTRICYVHVVPHDVFNIVDGKIGIPRHGNVHLFFLNVREKGQNRIHLCTSPNDYSILQDNSDNDEHIWVDQECRRWYISRPALWPVGNMILPLII